MDVIIAPKECKKLLRVKLPKPQDGQAQHFFHDEDNLALYEAIKFSDKYRSWFIDNLLCQDGHYNMMTKVDPIFILLPHIMKQARDRFRPLDDICQEFSANQAADSKSTVAGNNGQEEKFSRLETALAPGINWANVCDTQEIDGELFVKFSEKQTEEWLLKKHDKLMDVLRDELGSKASKATIMSNATDLICDYVPEELHEKFKAKIWYQYHDTKMKKIHETSMARKCVAFLAHNANLCAPSGGVHRAVVENGVHHRSLAIGHAVFIYAKLFQLPGEISFGINTAGQSKFGIHFPKVNQPKHIT